MHELPERAFDAQEQSLPPPRGLISRLARGRGLSSPERERLERLESLVEQLTSLVATTVAKETPRPATQSPSTPDTASRVSIWEQNAARGDEPSESLAALLKHRQLAILAAKARTPGTFELGVSNVPIDCDAFGADWRVHLAPDDPVRVLAETRGDIIEIGSERDYENTAAVLRLVDQGIAAEQVG